MSTCARCGKPAGDGPVCQYCGYAGESRSIVGKGVKTLKSTTGKVLETSVKATEKLAEGAKPVVKTVYDETRKGVRKAKEGTLKVAKSLQKET